VNITAEYVWAERWPCGLRLKSAAVWLLVSRVRFPRGHGCSFLVCVVCCVGVGLWDELINGSESATMCVCVCVWCVCGMVCV